MSHPELLSAPGRVGGEKIPTGIEGMKMPNLPGSSELPGRSLKAIFSRDGLSLRQHNGERKFYVILSEAKNLRVLGAGDSYPKGGHSGRSPATVQSDVTEVIFEGGPMAETVGKCHKVVFFNGYTRR
jgi:hypothetical protein